MDLWVTLCLLIDQDNQFGESAFERIIFGKSAMGSKHPRSQEFSLSDRGRCFVGDSVCVIHGVLLHALPSLSHERKVETLPHGPRGKKMKSRLFLVACARLYTPLCQSVGWSVTHLLYWQFPGGFCITALSQLFVTNSAGHPFFYKTGF